MHRTNIHVFVICHLDFQDRIISVPRRQDAKPPRALRAAFEAFADPSFGRGFGLTNDVASISKLQLIINEVPVQARRSEDGP